MSTTNKPIKLVCYTDNAAVFRYARLAKTSAYKPDWYKELPLDAGMNGLEVLKNMKLCSGFNDLFSKGFVLPMWSECNIRVGVEGDTDYDWQYTDLISGAEEHPQFQRGKWLPDDQYSHIKVISPWEVCCDESIDFLLTPIPWVSDRPEEFVVLSGILNFHYTNQINTNIMIKRTSEERIIRLDFGVPLAQFVPLSDRPIEIDARLVDSLELQKIRSANTRLVGKGQHYSHKRNKHDHGCPFSKGE